MALINIKLNKKIDIGNEIEIKFRMKNSIINKLPNFLILNDDIDHRHIIKKIKVIDFLGEGSYGSVFKIKIDNKTYAIKLSENELPNKLMQRYKSLCQNENLKRHVIKIYCCGKINDNYDSTYKYYCIMEYGGETLKSVNSSLSLEQLKSVLIQLCNIVHYSCKLRLLITDFKLGNLTITSKNKVKLIDIYMDCFNYSPCEQCKIVKTYSTLELDKEKRIYEDLNYNFTAIYVPLAVCLIDLVCENTISYYTSKICKKFNINITVKQLIPVLQIACYNYNNFNNNIHDNNSIKKLPNVKKFKKKLEEELKMLKNNDFYNYFLNLLEPQSKYKDLFDKKKLNIILNNLLSLDPNQRSLQQLKYLLTL
jgi:hypothetical protein